jgi:hypothetical protein
MGVIHIESEAQFNQLKQSSGAFGSPAAVVVDFSAEVCLCTVPCSDMHPLAADNTITTTP